MDEFETQDIQCGQAITYKEFYEAFNAISDYHACPATNYWKTIGAAIVDEEGELMATLYDDSRAGNFFDVSIFNSKELFLMAKLAANMPEFRGEINYGRD